MADQEEILQALRTCSQGDVLSLTDQRQLAGRFNCSLADIERMALEQSILPARFTRNSLSCDEQLRLFQSRVAIIGCGGLGGRSAELLARLGIGHLSLTDPDIFSESNLNRQIFCTTETLGRNKVEVLARELQKINPALTVHVSVNSFHSDSIAGVDIVIDGLDSTGARKELGNLCQKKNIPMIHGAVKEWYGQVGIEQSKTFLINTLYPQRTGPASAPTVMPMTVALIAAMQAAETCKILLKKDSALNDSWLQCDLLSCEYELIRSRR